MRPFLARLFVCRPILCSLSSILIWIVPESILAELVVPTDIKAFHQGDSLAGDGSVLDVINGSGMAKADPDDPATWTINSTAWQDDWQGFEAPGGANRTWAVLDLGAVTPNLANMYLWNVQENAPGNQSDRGMNSFNVFHATSPTVAPPATSGSVTPYDFGSGGWTQLSGSFSLAQGAGVGDGGQSFDVADAAGARYIGLQIVSNHGSNARVGFGEVAFTTEVPTGAPTVATLPAINVAASSARIRGDLVDLGVSTPSVILYWGPSDGGATPGGWATTLNLGAKSTVGEFSADLGGLAPAATYYFRAFAANAQGDDWAPTSVSFTTPADLPSVQNVAASNIEGTSASIGGEVTSTGGDPPVMVLYYGDQDAGTNAGSWDAQVNLGVQSGAATTGISALLAGTNYYYRAAATNSAGTVWAANTSSFTTTVVSPPSVINVAASGVNGTFATLNGEVTNAGGDTPAVTIYYGTTDGGTDAGSWAASSPVGNQSGTFSRLVTNLQPTTTYYFRARAQNVAGQAWATSSLSFTTPVFVAPTVVINEIHYDEDDKTLRAEFIEIHNPSNDAVDLSGYYFSNGIDYQFPGNTTLLSGGYLVVAEDPATMVSHFGYSNALGPFANGTTLKNSGERITLRDPAGNRIDEVDYRLGFPWPTVGDDVGSPLASPSIELINPLLDNDLGGSWRASGFPVQNAGGGVGGGPVTLLARSQSGWRYRKGTSYPAQDGAGRDWWDPDYNDSDDGAWINGTAVIGYGDGDDATLLNDMQSNYNSVFLRREFTIAPGELPASISLNCYHDDGAVVYLNGFEVNRFSVDGGAISFPPPNNFANSHEAGWTSLVLNIAASHLVEGANVIAIHGINQTLTSSDFSIDAEVIGDPDAVGSGDDHSPTPGAANSSFSSSAPPQIRQVDHEPKEPTSAQPVLVVAKITDPDGVASVLLQYQIVEPGDYFCRYLKFNNNGTPNFNPRYEDPAEWTTVAMTDDGNGGDALAADSFYSVTLPAGLQVNRRLIRYQIVASDTPGSTITVPYQDDPQPNFAYFVYDGTPDWSGVIRSGGASETYSGALMSSIPTYFLLSTNAWVDDSQFGGYGGSEYLWPGTLAYDGKIYDHIQYRPRGGGHRFDYGKNFWKFDFQRGHRFEARDRYGKRYATDWDKLNFSSIVQQVGFNHRGEQGLFEGVGFRLFELCGVPACKTHYTQFYVVDNASPTGANQYEGDYYGLFLAIEQMDGQYLDEHGLPDGNLYKIEGYNGQSNNQGPYAVSNGSDVSSFISAYRGGAQTEQWWRDNLDVENYLSYRTVVEGIHHYDIAYGKNYFYFHNPETDKFQVLPWDLDLCWANNMFGNGNHDFKTMVAQNSAFNTDYQNRVREIMDLIYNSDEGHRLIDEMVRDVWTPGAPSLVGADRRLWDNNPRLNSKDRYYDVAADNDFSGMIQILKNYIDSRGNWMVSNLLSQESSVPATPTITYSGGAGFPGNDLGFTSSAYSSPVGSGFTAMEWRVAEVYNPTVSNYLAGEPYRYEIENPFKSGELAVFNGSYLIPASVARPGRTYRARVRHKDSSGRYSHWSDPIEFLVSAPVVTPYITALRITELHYHPAAATAGEIASGWEDSDFEFVELQNVGPVEIDLTDIRFTKGIDFDFPVDMIIGSGDYLLVVKNQLAFESRYGAGLPIAGEWAIDNKLNNGGENVKLSLGAGTAIIEFAYSDLAPWPTSPDGGGFSLTLNCPQLTQPADHADPLAWRASVMPGGSPGSDDHFNFAAWALDNGLGAGALFTDDPDDDGLENFLEYALASNPLVDSMEDLPTAANELVVVGGGSDYYLTFTFRRPLAAKELTYAIEISSDLATWVDDAAVLVGSTAHGDGTVTETWRSPLPINGAPVLFMRLRVEG